MTCPYPVGITNPVSEGAGFERMYVGCGTCGACKHNDRADWSFRIMQEAKHSKSCYFITLTYHDSFLPLTENILPTLDKDHVQLFNKKLRKEQWKISGEKIRFFCVGEYGTKYGRPHYHLIYFNLAPHLAEPEVLLPIWEYGIPHRLSLDEGLTHYATKYHVTANKQRHLDYEDDRIDEFTRSSNKPPKGGKCGGIGYHYIEETKKFHLDSLTTVCRNNGYAQRMPGYYYRHIFEGLEDSVKEKMRAESEERYIELHNEECARLRKKGYKSPETEILRRQVYEAKNVKFKADKKGIF